MDIGCLNYPFNEFSLDGICSFIKSKSRFYLGVDREKDVLKLADYGYNVIWLDVYDLSLRKRFDVVFAGELIEHLDNHKRFLRIAHKHLKDNGILILTTPNPYFIGRFIQIIKEDDVHVSPEHYCYFCPKTLRKLLEDNKFKVIRFDWFSRMNTRRIGYIPTRLWDYFNTSFVMIARKMKGSN